MKRHKILSRSFLLGLMFAALAGVAAQAVPNGGAPGQGEQYDPFSEIHKAPPLQLKADDSAQPQDPPANVKAAADAIDYTVAVKPTEAKRGEVVRVTVTGVPRKGWYTYSMTMRTSQQNGPAVSKFKFPATPGVRPLGPIDETPAPELVTVPNVGAYFEHRGKFSWSFDVLVQPEAKVGTLEIPFAVALQ